MKIRKTKIERDEYSVDCQVCGQTITGNATETVLYNLDAHLRAKHPKKKYDIKTKNN